MLALCIILTVINTLVQFFFMSADPNLPTADIKVPTMGYIIIFFLL